MGRKYDTRLYNIMLPLWMIVFWPSWLWLVIIPLNYLIDRIVLRWSLGDMPDKGLFCRKHTWKIWLAGFASDFLGFLIMLGVFVVAAVLGDSSPLFDDILAGVGFNPFSNVVSFLIVALAVAVSGCAIFFIDRAILSRTGLNAEQLKKSALRLAIITAPYLYFFPSSIIYNSSFFVL